MRVSNGLGVIAAVLAIATNCAAADMQPKTTLQGSKVFFLAACEQTPATDYAYLAPPIGEGQEFAPLIAALITAVAPNVVDKLTSFVGNYFKKQAEEYSSTDTVVAPFPVPAKDSKIALGCMAYVAGEFGPTAVATSPDWTQQKLDEFGLSRPPKVYAEWVVHYADAAHKLVTLTPVHLEFASALSPKTSSSKTKDLSFVIQLNDPLGTPKAGTSSSVSGSLLPNAAAGNTRAPDPATVTKAVSGQAKAKTTPATKTDGKQGAPEAGGTAKQDGKQATDKSESNTGADAAPSAEASQSSVGQSLAVFAVHFPKMSEGSVLTLRALKGKTAAAQAIALTSGAVLNVQVTEIETENGGDFMLHLSQFVADNKSAIDPVLTDYLKKAVGQGQTGGTTNSSK